MDKRKNCGRNRSAVGSSLSDDAMQITLFFFSTSRDIRYLTVHYERVEKRTDLSLNPIRIEILIENVVFSERKHIAIVRIIMDINYLKDE